MTGRETGSASIETTSASCMRGAFPYASIFARTLLSSFFGARMAMPTGPPALDAGDEIDESRASPAIVTTAAASERLAMTIFMFALRRRNTCVGEKLVRRGPDAYAGY